MKEIIINNEQIDTNKVDETVIRTKALIINSKEEIILGFMYGEYQFPGGHLNEGEDLETCLKRELKEEVGIDFSNLELKPFAVLKNYSTNYRNTGKTRENVIYYYHIKSDKNYDLNNTNYDEYEEKNKYKVVKLPLIKFEETLLNNKTNTEINSCIVNEMLKVYDVFKENILIK